jgi:hypothetical protein
MNIYILSMELAGGIETVVLGAYSTFSEMKTATQSHTSNASKSHTPVYFYDVKVMDTTAMWTNQQMSINL